MKHSIKSSVLAMLSIIFIHGIIWASAPDLMTYQGRLKESGQPVTGMRDVRVDFCTLLSGGSCEQGSVQTVDVQNGLFRSTFTLPSNVDLATGNLFLEVWVGPVAGALNQLTPREKLTSSPYAMHAATAAFVQLNVSSITMLGPFIETGELPTAISAANLADGSVDNTEFQYLNGVTSAVQSQINAKAPLSGATSYIQNTDILQAGATFYISSGTVNALRVAGSIDLPANSIGSAALDNSSVTKLGAKIDLGSSAEVAGTLSGSRVSGGTFGAVNGLPGGSTSYIRNTGALQSGATFYVSSASVDGQTLLARISGNVGIGMDSPVYRMHIMGPSNNTYLIYSSNAVTSNNAYGIYSIADARNSATANAEASGGTFYGFGEDGSNGIAYGIRAYANAYGNAAAYGVYSDAEAGSTTGLEYAFYGLGKSFFSDKIGIGTANPSSEIHIFRAAGTGGSLLKVSTGTTNLLEVAGSSVSINAGTLYVKGGVDTAAGSGFNGWDTNSSNDVTDPVTSGALTLDVVGADLDTSNQPGITISTHVFFGTGATISTYNMTTGNLDLYGTIADNDLSSAITRDTDWDTISEINTAST
ncbi:MAG: hypothetical protein HY747_08730, partial [Elusimicrobia bacterium]|nr:hypothetical protein [Elusimicrobiota bacterium]